MVHYSGKGTDLNVKKPKSRPVLPVPSCITSDNLFNKSELQLFQQ